MLITYAGKERCDLVYYMIQLIQKAGKTVFVVDNSIRHDLYHLYDEEVKTDLIQQDAFTIAIDRNVNCDTGADFTIIYNGLYAMKGVYPLTPDMEIVAVSMDKTECQMTKETIEKTGIGTNGKTIFVMLDVITKKMSGEHMAEILGIQPTGTYLFQFDERDYGRYQLLTQNGAIRMKGMGDNFIEFLKDFAEVYLDINAKQYRKVIGR